MPGRHINDQQVRLYMTARIIRPQATAAAMAGISVATGRRLERDPRPPSSRKEARDYLPFARSSSIIMPIRVQS